MPARAAGLIQPAAMAAGFIASLDWRLDLYRHLNPSDPHPTECERKEHGQRSLGLLITVFVTDIAGFLAFSGTFTIIPNLARAVRPYGVAENVVTHSDHRRKGLGRSVLASAVNAAWEAGCCKISLATGSRRPEILRFYAGAGFGSKTFFEARGV